jgi:hypothetical protein
MQIKSALRFHFKPVRIAMIKKPTNAGKDGGSMGRRKHFALLVVIKISVATLEVSVEIPQKTKNRTTI